MTSFSRPIALSMRAFWLAVSLREGRTSSGFFFLPRSGRPNAAEAEKVVATKNASVRPAIECFRKIMIYGSCGDPRVNVVMVLMLVHRWRPYKASLPRELEGDVDDTLPVDRMA